MRSKSLVRWLGVCLGAALLAGVILGATTGVKESGAFSSSTIDIGVVVSDVEKAAKFYTEGLGLTEAPGFDVSADMGRDSGLTDNKAFRVRVFATSDDPTATKIKLMQFPDVESKKKDNTFIHSTLGFNYLTIRVADIDAAVARAVKAGAKPLAKGPYLLPRGKNTYLTLVRDPDGNLIELVGPK